ncbi:3-keto-disaccharide hydrolase [Pedobacter arcticus]|uniref:3-keto-disaccharide hydrolase n=1 Tax=Pedobacter arcticus TaxID=752140 RepID=UPI0002DF16A5|nr:DUF1080 domain-containing protein [Pedobacter arcticus]
MKKYAIPIFSIAIFFISCGTQKSKSQPWVDLLSNNISQNWHTYGQQKAGTSWSIQNGILHFNPTNQPKKERGDLASNETFENFHLKYDWKIAENGNSGVMFNVNDDAKKYAQPYFTGPEMQVLDNNGHPDAKIFKHRAGDLYDLIPSSVETAKPFDEWNKAEIILNKGELQFILNGKQIVKTTLWDAEWDKIVPASKFKEMPDFGKFRSGKIVLQDHGNQVWFKNILIKKL